MAFIRGRHAGIQSFDWRSYCGVPGGRRGCGKCGGRGGSGSVSFEIVRHQMKLEPPLKNLVGMGGLGFISTIAEVTFYGHDQNGNEVTVTGRIDVQFGDFADK